MIGRACASILLAAALCGSASAETIMPPALTHPDWACQLIHPSQSVDSLKVLPKAARDALYKRISVMADRGEPFNPTDVIMTPAPSQRFIRGGRVGPYWFVWYEQGGIAYSKNILLFASDATGAMQIIAALQEGYNANLCAETDRMVDQFAPARR